MISWKDFAGIGLFKKLLVKRNAVIEVEQASGSNKSISADELSVLDGITSTATEINILDGVTATAAEINNAADVSARVEEITATGAVTAGVQVVELNHVSTIAAATIADSTNHEGLFVVKNTSASGTAAHTLTLTAGTFDGTNNVATLNAPGECLVVYFDSAGNGVIVENIGTVGVA